MNWLLEELFREDCEGLPLDLRFAVSGPQVDEPCRLQEDVPLHQRLDLHDLEQRPRVLLNTFPTVDDFLLFWPLLQNRLLKVESDLL